MAAIQIFRECKHFLRNGHGNSSNFRYTLLMLHRSASNETFEACKITIGLSDQTIAADEA